MSNALHWILQPDLAPLLGHGQVVFLLIVGLILFAETGLLVGFFLPGDSLLFSAGLVVALAGSPNPLVLAVVVFVAACIGDQTGYLIGKKAGPALYRRPDGRLFKQEYVERSRLFFEKHGGRAIVLARFVPIVRTFTPAIAGVSSMHYRRFLAFNVIGAFAWAVVVSMAGYVLGKRFPGLEHVLTPFLLGIVVLSLLPAAFEIVKARRAPIA